MRANAMMTAAALALAGSVSLAYAGPARTMSVPQSQASVVDNEMDDAGLVTVFNNLASRYPKGRFWCCEGYNVMGPQQGEQWMAAAFTPGTDHVVTRVEVAAGWSQGTNGIVVSLAADNNGEPETILRTWNVSHLQNFGTCCAIVSVSDSSGIAVMGGQQYWTVLSTSGKETNTVDGWNVDDTDQIDQSTLASYDGTQWHVFQAAPDVAFAVKGSS